LGGAAFDYWQLPAWQLPSLHYSEISVEFSRYLSIILI